MHQLIDERYNELLRCIQNGDCDTRTQTFSLNRSPTFLKGRKPTAVSLPNGITVAVTTWREVAKVLLQDCAHDEARHAKMQKLCGSVSGNRRILLSSDPSGMDVPIRIDDSMYFEGKFDTEYLIRMMRERIFDRVGYDCSQVRIILRAEYSPTVFAALEPTSAGEDESDAPTLTL